MYLIILINKAKPIFILLLNTPCRKRQGLTLSFIQLEKKRIKIMLQWSTKSYTNFVLHANMKKKEGKKVTLHEDNNQMTSLSPAQL